MVGGKEDDLQKMMDRLNKTTTECGIKISTKKTMVMKISRIEGEEKNNYENNNRPRRNRTGHLGSLISDDAKCYKDINKRIAMGKEAFTKRKMLLKGGLNRDIKKRIVKALIWNVML